MRDRGDRELHISPHLVRDHVKGIFAKCVVCSRAEQTATLLQQRTV